MGVDFSVKKMGEPAHRITGEVPPNVKWDLRFLDLARLISTWSKDPSTQCGAVIVRTDKTIASTGFNGFPRGCEDDPKIYANRTEKYRRILHAEENALLSCVERPRGYTLYTWPPGMGPTCERCATSVIQSGIENVVYCIESEEFAARWAESQKLALELYQQAKVKITCYSEFIDPKNLI